jgi:hypothetical protein
MERLVLEDAKGSQVSLRRQDLFDACAAKGTDEFVFEVGIADEKSELLHSVAGQVRSEPRALETAPKVALLGDVAEAHNPNVQSVRPEFAERPTCVRGAAKGEHPDARQFPATTPGECLDRDAIAGALDEENGLHPTSFAGEACADP